MLISLLISWNWSFCFARYMIPKASQVTFESMLFLKMGNDYVCQQNKNIHITNKLITQFIC